MSLNGNIDTGRSRVIIRGQPSHHQHAAIATQHYCGVTGANDTHGAGVRPGSRPRVIEIRLGPNGWPGRCGQASQSNSQRSRPDLQRRSRIHRVLHNQERQ